MRCSEVCWDISDVNIHDGVCRAQCTGWVSRLLWSLLRSVSCSETLAPRSLVCVTCSSGLPRFSPSLALLYVHYHTVWSLYIDCLELNLTYLRTPFLTGLFFHVCRLVFLSWLQFVRCLCILFLFYLTVLFACMIWFYYNVFDCHAFNKGKWLTYLIHNTLIVQ